jgi:hypothetical protein
MIIKYRLTLDDVIACGLYDWRRRIRRLRIIVAMLLGAFVWVFCSYMDLLLESHSPMFAWLLSGASVVALLIGLPMQAMGTMRRRLEAEIGKNGHVDSILRSTCQISPEGIQADSDLRKTLTRWPMIDRLVDVGDRIFLCVRGLGSIVVPARVFSDLAQREEFLRFARQQMEAPAPVPMAPPT